MIVVVAIDTSSQAKTVAQSLQAFAPIEQIVLVHAYDIPQLAYPGTGMSVGHEFSRWAETALQQEGTRICQEISELLSDEHKNIRIRLERGSPAEVILTVCEEEKAQLVVLGSRGLGVIREHVIGSVSHRVFSHSPCSTLVVKETIDAFERILIPVENQEDARHLISFLRNRPFRGMRQHLVILHVIPFIQSVLPFGAFIPDKWQKDLHEGGNHLTQELARGLEPLGFSTSTTLRAGSPAAMIAEEAKGENAALIMMASQRVGKFSRFLLGSVAHSVMHHVSPSILLVR